MERNLSFEFTQTSRETARGLNSFKSNSNVLSLKKLYNDTCTISIHVIITRHFIHYFRTVRWHLSFFAIRFVRRILHKRTPHFIVSTFHNAPHSIPHHQKPNMDAATNLVHLVYPFRTRRNRRPK